jgi:hypothetical protein
MCVLLTTPSQRIVDLLHYVKDGGMLSAQLTRSMTLQMVTYNPEAAVFGYFSATFRSVPACGAGLSSHCLRGKWFSTWQHIYHQIHTHTHTHTPSPSHHTPPSPPPYPFSSLRWIDSGVISMTHKLMALPAVEFSHVVSTWQLQVRLATTWYYVPPFLHLSHSHVDAQQKTKPFIPNTYEPP